jgi:hypothetical protein
VRRGHAGVRRSTGKKSLCVRVALAAMNAVRLATASVRFRGRHWTVVGAEVVIA